MENWKEALGFEGLYWVSDLGNVKSKRGMLQPQQHRGKYKKVSLSRLGKIKNKPIHRLVKETFHGVSDQPIDHINGVQDDNRLVNLEYVTSRENSKRHYQKDKTKTSRFVGVSLYESTGRWKASIYKNGRTRTIGYYNDEAKAKKAYDFAISNTVENARMKFPPVKRGIGKGYSYDKSRDKFMSFGTCPATGKKTTIGRFKTEGEAIASVALWRAKHFVV